ncbi:hydroxyethylthiazole kinase [Paragemmobacter straminiformis]|uniref:Hydroxyethylthiazole kinase n=1 Tax=Paragemmobacter straminiformis TaxID=2045119 RepID=A0A842IBW1_9RHOB|nr:hydroxyethylthiazole kinase [Gemmobacter straminiformis]MBC2837340.1 hydroxyethylthiazole kinase [Gemmobacter straminiformis]
MTDWGQNLATMRRNAPLVQNITNYVAMNVMANVMLAAGASPAMVHAEEEVAEFAGFTPALTINIGTLSGAWVRSMLLAAKTASARGTPWVLDPVAAGATTFRRETAAALVALKPTVIRGNASEILALSGAGAAGKGVDAADAVGQAEAGARTLARATGSVVAVTGAVDFVTDGTRAFHIANGHATMPLVTALGCSLTGIVGAFLVGQPPLEATVAALAYYGLAGECAAATAKGPGSFATAFVDALANLTPAEVSARARVTQA